MLEYIEKSRKMSNLYKKADSAHTKMLDAVKRAQPSYEKSTSASVELRDIKSQLDRARELLKQSDKAIEHWEIRLKKGFGDIGPGFPTYSKDMIQLPAVESRLFPNQRNQNQKILVSPRRKRNERSIKRQMGRSRSSRK